MTIKSHIRDCTSPHLMKQLLILSILSLLLLKGRCSEHDFCTVYCDAVPVRLCTEKWAYKQHGECERLPVEDDFRFEVVKLHNEVRSAVSTGGTLLPSAADMSSVEYDRHMEYISQRMADNCHTDYVECDKTDTKGAVGQTYYVFDVSQRPFSLKDIMEEWTKEAASIPVTSVGNFSTKFSSNYTQVIWAQTRIVGCAKTTIKSENKIYFFCTYSPKGNVDEKPIYTVGPPCSNCSHCNTVMPGLCGHTMEFPTVGLQRSSLKTVSMSLFAFLSCMLILH